MTSKKQNSDSNEEGKPQREQRQGKRTKPPTPAERERAAVELFGALAPIVREILTRVDHTYVLVAGREYEPGTSPWGVTWSQLRRSKGLEQAVGAYAEAKIIEERRQLVGEMIGRVALRYVRGELTEEQTVREAMELRGYFVRRDGDLETDDTPLRDPKEGRETLREADRGTLRKATAKSRIESTRWVKAYAVLTKGADVVPAADRHARTCRNDKLTLYNRIATRNR